MQEVPLEAVHPEEYPSKEKSMPNSSNPRISVWRLLYCIVPIFVSATVSVTAVHVCKNEGFVYGAAIAALCAIGIYFFNICLVIAVSVTFLGLRTQFCNCNEETKETMAARVFNAINIFNVFLAVVLAIVVVCVVSVEHRRYDTGIPWSVPEKL